MPTAMVTGSPERLTDITVALKSRGFDILSAGDDAPTGAGGLVPGSVDCYIQLPAGDVTANGSAVDRARAVIAEEVLARFDAAARLAPLLAPHATVVLVADRDDDPSPPADVRALRRLVGVLAEAIVRDHGPEGVRTTVVGESRAPEDIAALAHAPFEPARPWSSFPAHEPDLPFADWRDEVLCLLSIQA